LNKISLFKALLVSLIFVGVSCEIRGSSFVDGGAEIGDELHFESLGKARGAAEIS